MKGGEKVNVGSIQAFVKGAQQMNVNDKNTQGGNQKSFGSVLSNIAANNVKPVNPVNENTRSSANEVALAISNATTVEELVEVLEQVESQLFSVHNVQEVLQANGLVGLDLEKIMETVLPLLEKAGLSESELAAAAYLNDIWSLLDVIDTVAPKFFTELMNVLEGKTTISKEQAIDLLALLKSVTITAPRTDLLLKQEQQVFSLQGHLVATAERLESTSSNNNNRTNVIQLLEAQYNVRINVQNETKDGSLKDTPKEASQHVVMHSVTRNEVPLAELENRNNTRNETLMREMQNIFKRSNFGQTGGTNRLLIKLYPEHLGQVRIELLQTNGILIARILASTALGKEMLDSQLHQLRNAFLQQNLQVERIDITQTLQDATRSDRQHEAFNQHFKNEQDGTDEQEGQTEEEEMTFGEYMIELEV